MGHVYVKVFEHLNTDPITIIKNKFRPEYKYLIMYYSQQLRAEQKQYEEMKEKIE